jgi:hypothetical protein
MRVMGTLLMWLTRVAGGASLIGLLAACGGTADDPSEGSAGDETNETESALSQGPWCKNVEGDDGLVSYRLCIKGDGHGFYWASALFREGWKDINGDEFVNGWYAAHVQLSYTSGASQKTLANSEEMEMSVVDSYLVATNWGGRAQPQQQGQFCATLWERRGTASGGETLHQDGSICTPKPVKLGR